jgi:hypothetical protein
MMPEQHARLYALFYSAYLGNEERGYAEQASLNRRQMEDILSFGKISEADRMIIEARTCEVRAEVGQIFDQVIAMYQEQPNTTRH